MLYFDKSQSPQAGQFNSYDEQDEYEGGHCPQSQSPQTGQFNSYLVSYQ